MKKFKQLFESDGMKFHDAIDHAKKHGNRVVYGTKSLKWHSIDKGDRDYHTALEPDEAKRHGMAKSLLMSTQTRRLEEEFKVGDVVVPDKGVHAGQPHEVIHVHGNGKINIRPKGIHPKTVKYRLGAATADPSELRPHFNLHEQTGINRTVVQEAFEAAKKKKKDAKTPKAGTKSIEVKGPGPDEKFQKDPVVSPVITTAIHGSGMR